jgi:hypothetical protein
MKSGEVLGTPFSGGRTIIKNPSYFNSGLIFPCRTSLTTMPAITSVTLNYGQARYAYLSPPSRLDLLTTI